MQVRYYTYLWLRCAHVRHNSVLWNCVRLCYICNEKPYTDRTKSSLWFIPSSDFIIGDNCKGEDYLMFCIHLYLGNLNLYFICRYELKVRFLPKSFQELFQRDKVTFFYLYDQVRWLHVEFHVFIYVHVYIISCGWIALSWIIALWTWIILELINDFM